MSFINFKSAILIVIVFIFLFMAFNISTAEDPSQHPTANPIKLHTNTDLEDDTDDGDGVNHFYFSSKSSSLDDMTVSYTANGSPASKLVEPGDTNIGIFPDSGTAITVSIPENPTRTCRYTKGTWSKGSEH